MKKIVILGSEGYIGTKVVDFLSKKKNYYIEGVDNLIYSQPKKLKKLTNYNFRKIDIRNLRKTTEVCKDAHCVVILAGLVGDPITKKYKKLSTSINLFAIKKLIQKLNKTNIEKLIFVSTCSNYGIKKNKLLKENAKLEPISLYSKHKVIIENYLLKNDFRFSKTILRFATAFGLSKRMRFDLTVNEFVKTAFLKENLEIYHGQTYRPYCHVNDFAKIIHFIIKSPTKKTNGEVFNCGSNNNNFNKIQIGNMVKKKFKSLKIEKVSKNLDLRNYKVDFSKIQKFMGKNNKFISVEYGIDEIKRYLKSTSVKESELKKLGNFSIKKN